MNRIDADTLNRALIGFDTMFNNFERRFANSISSNYPPHNVVKLDDNNYEIQIAVTGFNKDEVITVKLERVVPEALKPRRIEVNYGE